MEAMFGHVKGEPYGRYAHSLGSKSTSTSDFLLGLAGCIVLSPPVRAVTVAKRREYKAELRNAQHRPGALVFR